ncbi:GrpB family protein [Devosia sp. 1635]|uniref:GrpB family protein n=1 Tax=Devosia sp. 1635 TaxID=2726066 RepID=UPI0015630F87|nr:GrpB family protein [Devosia sp. 1635]
MAHHNLGLEHGRVRLAVYNQGWRAAFEEEASDLRQSLASRVCGLEHVGSTSISGLMAKPILDLLLGLSNLDDGPGLASELAKLDYEFRPDAGLPAEHVYAKGTPRTHVLHVVEIEGEAWQQKLAFRDALRDQPELARAYQELKVSLSLLFPDDRAAYTAGKTEFVKGVVSSRLGNGSFHSRHA